jgi:hypothetical protein
MEDDDLWLAVNPIHILMEKIFDFHACVLHFALFFCWMLVWSSFVQQQETN